MRLKTALGLLLLVGCVKHIETHLGYPRPSVTSSFYGYQEIQPGVFYVWARDPNALEIAKEKIGCKPCTVERIPGTFYSVRKPK